MLSSLRTVAARAVIPTRLAVASRSLSYTPRVLSDDHHGHAPVIHVGTGAKAGEVATDENQSTGLERFQIAGQNAGVDVFNMEGLHMTRQGTLKNPIIVPSFSELRQIGCTGFPVDSHDTIWLAASTKRENSRCPECGNVYKLQMVQLDDFVTPQEHQHQH
ncbi:Cytochrome c oxidase subunit 4 [Tulasnella sp. JGI-2019a]|nr:Cytochrome c oxidase subunit 4 [Tulasnella sp. JGI-2019a]KAG9031138.1 Cytochrome c oxidase subunit 4 [Tulasnella sp. JGI-2019a]